MELLFNLFNAIEPLGISLQDHLHGILKKRVVKRKEIILKEGDISKYIYFIEKGLVRSIIHFEEKEYTSWFMREGDIFIAVQSFFDQEPAQETIEALEDGFLHGISHKQLNETFEQYPEFNKHRAVLLQKYYTQSEKRHFMRMKPAYFRYKYLMDNQPDLVGRVADKYLASYLGITRSTLSLEKSKYAKGIMSA